MEKEEKSEKSEKRGKEKHKENPKSRRFFEIGSFLLLVALVVIILIVVQVPYITTDAIVETVPVEKCSLEDVPFVANFKTGLNYDAAMKIYSSEGEALYRYSELKTYLYANIRNTGEEKGIYCINVKPYLISYFEFEDEEDALASFRELLSEDSERLQKLSNEANTKYDYPVCTEKPISPIDTKIISLWTPNIISEDIQKQYSPDDVYVLFSVIPPMSEQCSTEDVEQTAYNEVTRYCNAWKHVVGMC